MSVAPVNRLKDSASPYLRSAAHQPVDWHEWGPDAFARARAEDKPILLDIGAVWCHWCHVIDRESYENPEIAALINRHFIAVKVDRDERPDVDARYQAAVSTISGQGGWPLTAFLTPDGKPFFGGTYFPPDDAMGRPGFRHILGAIAEAYRTRSAEVAQSAAVLADAVAKAESFQGARGAFDPAVVEAMEDSIVRMFDLRNGGFGQAPKFPHPSAIEFLLERYQTTREKSLLSVVETTLQRMAQGGVYDQLAGGFHRYSVDERWRVPHFEKMSYDNSELLKNYLHGWQVTRNAFFRETAEGVIAWVFDELSDAQCSGFFASQDADYSLDDDGDYFTWTLEELRAALPTDEARVAELSYDVESHGEMHHNPAKNVLWLARTPAEIAALVGKEEVEIRLLLTRAKQKLIDARRRRPAPAVDRTVYVSWNAMMASAFLEAANVLERADCREFALRSLDRIHLEAWDETSGFLHRAGGPRLAGTLDDQILMAVALLDAYEATLDLRWFELAAKTMRLALARHWDGSGAGFFDRAADADTLSGLDVRRKPFQDSPTPGTNTVAVLVLDRLFTYTGETLFRERAEQTLEAFARIAPQYGLFAATYGLAALLHARGVIEVIVTGIAEDPSAARLEQAAHSVFRFGKTVLRISPERLASAGLAPALAKIIPNLVPASPQAFLCAGTTCLPPVTDPEELKELLRGASARALR